MLKKLLAALGLTLFLAASALAASQTQPVGGTTGGSWAYHYLSGASTNATSVTTAKNTLYNIAVFNATSTIYFLKFYDVATTPTCNTDTVIMTVLIPFGQSASGGGAVVSIPVGMRFLHGVAFCITGAVADNDNSNAATGLVIDLVGF